MSSGEVTGLIQKMGAGDCEATERLYALIYPTLRQMAAAMMRLERPGHTLQPTALVHEAAMKLLDKHDMFRNMSSRVAFFAVAAQAMRRVLVDHARRRSALKRQNGNTGQAVALDEVVHRFQQSEQLDLLALDEALQRLGTLSQRQHDIVILRFFGGLRCQDIATHLSVSKSTVEKDWQFARAWLRKELREGLE